MEFVAFPFALIGFVFSLYALDEIKKLKGELKDLKSGLKNNKKDK